MTTTSRQLSSVSVERPQHLVHVDEPAEDLSNPKIKWRVGFSDSGIPGFVGLACLLAQPSYYMTIDHFLTKIARSTTESCSPTSRSGKHPILRMHDFVYKVVAEDGYCPTVQCGRRRVR
jgi:hypothetical protein